MRRWTGISRRLFFAFGALVLFIAAASYSAMAGLFEIHRGLHAVKREEAGVRAVLELATAIRDQYAHQAHTIIIGNDSHLGMYAEARERVVRQTQRVREQLDGSDKPAIDDIERQSRELDRLFRSEIVPAVLGGQMATVKNAHGRALDLVWSIQGRTDALVGRFEASIEDFELHAQAIQHATYRWTALLLASSILFAAWVAFYIRRSVVAPLARLEAGAGRVAEGDLGTTIQVESQDEFGRLAHRFNTMTKALKGQRDRLIETEKLVGVGRLAAGVAHEINNPLGVILGYVRVLRRHARTPLSDDLRVIEDEAVRCQEIVEGLLDLSRPSIPPTTDVDLRELCDDVVERLRESHAVNGVNVSIEGAMVAPAHPLKLRQVLTNLIKNAAEAAGAGGVVNVATARCERWATVTISDSGPGISEENRSQLFEPFFTTKPAGTGLGLAVSLAIARAHGGSIEVERAAEGGALFRLKLPVRREDVV